MESGAGGFLRRKVCPTLREADGRQRKNALEAQPSLPRPACRAEGPPGMGSYCLPRLCLWSALSL